MPGRSACCSSATADARSGRSPPWWGAHRGGASERLVDSIAEAARQLVTLGFLVPVAQTGKGEVIHQPTSRNPRRTLLRRAAWAAGGLAALVAGAERRRAMSGR